MLIHWWGWGITFDFESDGIDAGTVGNDCIEDFMIWNHSECRGNNDKVGTGDQINIPRDVIIGCEGDCFRSTVRVGNDELEIKPRGVKGIWDGEVVCAGIWIIFDLDGRGGKVQCAAHRGVKIDGEWWVGITFAMGEGCGEGNFTNKGLVGCDSNYWRLVGHINGPHRPIPSIKLQRALVIVEDFINGVGCGDEGIWDLEIHCWRVCWGLGI